MKMKTNKFMTYALSAMMLGSLAACSSDDSVRGIHRGRLMT